ncbi:fimbrial protein [Escherichia albertii]|uniref:fimbrial protein n=1 Tax=Escherichia albertii TaxID=208962 RepID=UPI002361418B|nr:fimbrial protein [Escherichia albertii]WDC33702.1 fimbrial protein [Escherichia albertii]
MQKKNNRLLINLCSIILLFFISSRYTLANECYIERNASGPYEMTITPTPFNIQTQMVTTPSEIAFAVWDVHIDLRGDKIGCKSLGSGTSSVHFINTAEANLLSTYTTSNGYGLLKTTVPGIVYSVELVCISCGAADELDLHLPGQSNGDSHTDNASTRWAYEYSDNSWYLRFRFFWTPEFKPQNGVSEGFAIPGKIASWYIGNSNQPWIDFFVTANSVHFYVDEPTCAMIALAQDGGNVSGNEIKLGNNYISEVNSGNTAVVPFSIRAEYCYASKITAKLKAANAASDANLVGKTSGSASGVAVKVHSTYNDSKVLLKPDGVAAIDYSFPVWSNNLLYFPFTAQLVPDGSGTAISTGTFSGNATFSFTYE